MPERADQRELVHLPSQARQMFADLDAVDVGLDLLELAAKFLRGIRLHIEGVDGAEPAVQEEEDERDIARPSALAGTRVQLQQTRQTQAEETGGAEAEKITPTDAVAELSRSHGDAPLILLI